MELKRVKNLKKSDYQLLYNYHKEHVRLNFPGSVVRKDLFKKQIEANLKDSQAYLFFAQEKLTPHAFLWLRIEKDPFKLPRPYHYLDLHYIHVDPEWRGTGIGSTFMKFVQTFAKTKKCKEIRLGTFIGNSQAIRLYKKHGFAEYRIIMRAFT